MNEVNGCKKEFPQPLALEHIPFNLSHSWHDE
jgi:hypothetical protein